MSSIWPTVTLVAVTPVLTSPAPPPVLPVVALVPEFPLVAAVVVVLLFELDEQAAAVTDNAPSTARALSVERTPFPPRSRGTHCPRSATSVPRTVTQR